MSIFIPAVKAAASIFCVASPPVGTITALTLLAEMTAHGALSDKQAANLADLAPMARDSGAFRGKRVDQR